MNYRRLVLGALFLIVSCSVVAFASWGERERSFEGTMSSRIEGTWRISLLGKNSHGVWDCGRDLSELGIHVDEWYVPAELRERLAKGDYNALDAANSFARQVSNARWGETQYRAWARGKLRVGSVEAPMFLAFSWEQSFHGPWILVDPINPRGPLSGCGWEDRLHCLLYVSPGNMSGKNGWGSDHLLVSFGQDAKRAMWPHEYARVESKE